MQEQLGEVPEEFLDPIMRTLMLDPVRLPTSGHTMDRSVIMRHLLTERMDPFNRAELTPEMLEDDTEMKQKVFAFVTSKGLNPETMNSSSP